jgi:hypothetical protein
MKRKYNLGVKLNVPLMKNLNGTFDAPIYSDRDISNKAYLGALFSNKAPPKEAFVELEIVGYYEGNYQGLNNPYFFRITKENSSHFRSNKSDPQSGILGTKFSSLTPAMQSLTILSSTMRDDEFFYAIEKDVVENYFKEVTSSQTATNTTPSQQVNFNSVNTTNKESVTMSNTKTPGQIFKSDLEKSAYRVAARQTAKVAKSAILSVVKNKSADKRKANKAASAVQEILDTDLGTYGVSEALGWALTYAPGLKEHPNAQRLAEELRVEGLAGAGDLALDKVLQSLVPSMVSVLNSLPAVEKSAQPTESLAEPTVAKSAEPEVEQELVTLSATNYQK